MGDGGWGWWMTMRTILGCWPVGLGGTWVPKVDRLVGRYLPRYLGTGRYYPSTAGTAVASPRLFFFSQADYVSSGGLLAYCIKCIVSMCADQEWQMVQDTGIRCVQARSNSRRKLSSCMVKVQYKYKVHVESARGISGENQFGSFWSVGCLGLGSFPSKGGVHPGTLSPCHPAIEREGSTR